MSGGLACSTQPFHALSRTPMYGKKNTTTGRNDLGAWSPGRTRSLQSPFSATFLRPRNLYYVCNCTDTARSSPEGLHRLTPPATCVHPHPTPAHSLSSTDFYPTWVFLNLRGEHLVIFNRLSNSLGFTQKL